MTDIFAGPQLFRFVRELLVVLEALLRVGDILGTRVRVNGVPRSTRVAVKERRIFEVAGISEGAWGEDDVFASFDVSFISVGMRRRRRCRRCKPSPGRVNPDCVA